ncbi:MAG: V-type ATP synthase subunit I [Anaerolineae bacterium]
MFRAEPMRKFELIVPEHDIVAVTETLAASRVFHVMPPEETERQSSVSRANEWTEKANVYSALEQRILDVMAVLGVEEGAPPPGPLHLIGPDLAERDIDAVEEEAKGPAQELETARRELAELQRTREQIEPLKGLDVELEALRTGRYLFSMLGTMPVDNIERLETSLDYIPSLLVVLQKVNHLAAVVLFGVKRDAEILRRAARSAYLNPIEFPTSYEGTPAEVLAALEKRINRTREQIAEYQATVHHLHDARIRRLRHILWRVRASRKVVETIAGFQRLQYAYLAVGWVLASKVDALRARVVDVSEDTVIEVLKPTAQEQDSVPFEFANPPIVRMFEQLVTTYGYPRYNELDPTPLIALTFPLIFGVMFGDVGHGLFLILLGVLVLSRKVKFLEGVRGFAGVIIACGGTATIFGFLYGSLFGFEDVIPSLWLRPLERTTDILLVSVFLGASVLTLGMVYNVVGAVFERRWGEALFDRNGLAGILFYGALLGLGATLMNVDVPISKGALFAVLLITALTIATEALLSPLIEGESIQTEALGLTLTEGFFELFETVLGFLSNTLSYVRMGAFAVAHGALSLVVFILARLVSPDQDLGYWLVIVIGNLVVIGFEGMIVAIQTLRLEYYEFFSKFFAAGGKRYQPLVLIPEVR